MNIGDFIETIGQMICFKEQTMVDELLSNIKEDLAKTEDKRGFIVEVEMTCKIKGLNISKFFEHMNDDNDEDNNSEGGTKDMKHNAFDKNTEEQENVLCHDSEQDKQPLKFVASKEMEEYFKNNYGGEDK